MAAFDEFDAFNGTETAEVGEGKKKDEDNLPPEWLPSALSVLALFGVVTSHALFHLLCRWTPTFEASALFTAAESEREADSILIHPPANRGKPAIVKIDRSFDKGEYAADAEGAAPLGRVSFQRQQFLLYPGHVSPLPLPTDLPVSYYLNSKGIDPEDVKKLRDKHGVNDTSLPPPKFVTLLMEQMLSPLAVFQVFSSLLWFLDGYSIMYTLVNLGTTVMFEGMTVFQRTKTQGMLGGMGGVHRKINVFRNEWMTVDEKEVLPGDLVVVEEGSIAFDCVIIGGAGVVNEAMLTGGFFVVKFFFEMLTFMAHLSRYLGWSSPQANRSPCSKTPSPSPPPPTNSTPTTSTKSTLSPPAPSFFPPPPQPPSPTPSPPHPPKASSPSSSAPVSAPRKARSCN